MTETQEHPAAGFDVDDWLQDAHMPEESTDVYKRADVIGKLSDLKRQIEIRREALASTEKTAGQVDELAGLSNQYQDLVETFATSQLTVYVRALSRDEQHALRTESDKRTKDLPQKQQNEDYGYALLSAAIIAVRPFEGERADVTWTREQVRKLEHKIGPAQVTAILQAQQLAQNRLPQVDADFLHKPSGGGDGQD